MKKLPFEVGQWVRVYGYVERLRLGERGLQVEWRRRGTKPLLGQVVGATYRQDGEIVPGSGGSISIYGCGDDYEPTCFVTTRRFLVWQVRLGLLNRPIEALERDLTPAEEPVNGLPWRYSADPGAHRRARAYELWDMRDKARQVATALRRREED